MARQAIVTSRSESRPGSAFELEQVLRVVLIVLGMVGCALRFREAMLHNPMSHLFSDPLRHWDHGKAPLMSSPMALIDPPVFQMWMSLVQKITLGDPVLMGAYAGLLSVSTPWLWYCFMRDFLRSKTLALAGWAVLAWMPSWISIYSYTMTETLFLPLMGASLWQTVRARRLRTVGSFCGMVALWTLTGMTRGIGIPLAGMCGIWVWLRHPHKLRTIGWSLVIVFVMMAPIAVRNYRFLNLWSPLGSGWLNQVYAESGKKNIQISTVRDGSRVGYEFGSPSLYAKQLAPLSNWEPGRSGTVKVAIDLRRGTADWKATLEQTAAHGSERLRLRWENMVLVMLGESWPDNNMRYPVAAAASRLRWVWAPLMLAVLLVAAVRFRDTLARPLLPVLIVTWFVFQAPSLVAVNEGRYRKPLEGLLVVQVLVLVEHALERQRAARQRALLFPSSQFGDEA